MGQCADKLLAATPGDPNWSQADVA